MEKENLVSITEAARRKECARTSIYRALKDGRLKTSVVGGRQFVVMDEDFRILKLRQVEESLGKQVRVLQEKVKRWEESLKEVREKVIALESRETKGFKEKEEKAKGEKKIKPKQEKRKVKKEK
jgi:hypothetical protein